jgi:hypothetical protein
MENRDQNAEEEGGGEGGGGNPENVEKMEREDRRQDAVTKANHCGYVVGKLRGG